MSDPRLTGLEVNKDGQVTSYTWLTKAGDETVEVEYDTGVQEDDDDDSDDDDDDEDEDEG